MNPYCRTLLLATIPALVVSLIVLVFSQLVEISTVVNAALSTLCVVIYFCVFVTAYGPIPNILCSEIFPTRVRGLCIAICALVYWIGDIIVTYTLPTLLDAIGLAGIFGIYAVVCVISSKSSLRCLLLVQAKLLLPRMSDRMLSSCCCWGIFASCACILNENIFLIQTN